MSSGAWVTHNALTQWIRKLKAGSLLPHFNIFDCDNHCPCRQQRALIIPNVIKHPATHWRPELSADFISHTEATVAAEAGIATPISSTFPSKRWWPGGEKGWASDAGWGCMLGTGYSSLATALIHLHLRRGKLAISPATRVYHRLCNLCPNLDMVLRFAIYAVFVKRTQDGIMAQAGKELGKDVMWFGLSTAAGAIKSLVQSFPDTLLAFLVAVEGQVFQTDVYSASHPPT
ncbi:hypothetical protein EI94DRAFT_1789117 [Lactarius quietus]|nr:hypothetical protein EI94DRAFT_1789117 [Lactarius quietus]